MAKFNQKAAVKTLTEGATIGAGTFAADKVEEAALKYLPDNMVKYSAGVPIIAGVLLSNQRNPMIKSLALGMIAGGVKNIAEEFIPGINGLGNLDQYLNGFDDGDTINGPINGSDSDDYSEFDEVDNF